MFFAGIYKGGKCIGDKVSDLPVDFNEMELVLLADIDGADSGRVIAALRRDSRPSSIPIANV